MKKQASKLVAGDIINRMGNACKVVSARPHVHPIGGDVILVEHTNGKQSASLSFKPSHLVEIIS